MMRSIFLCSAFLLVACVTDGQIITDAGTDTGSQPDVGVSDVGSDSQDVAVDSPLVCDGGSTVMACNGSCVDVASSGTNCGKCGHDCGGSTCTAGACQPSIVADKLTYPVFDVDATNVYFNAGPVNYQLDLETCPSSGCKLGREPELRPRARAAS